MDLKIVILVSTLEIGGAEKQSVLLHNSLNKNYETFMIIFYGKRIDDKLWCLVEKKENILCLKGSFFNKLIKIYRFFKQKKVSFLFSFLTLPNLIGGILGRLAGVKNIYGSIRNTKLQSWKIIIERIVANRLSSHTIVNSYNAESIFNKKAFKNVITIPNCFPKVDKPVARDFQVSNLVNIITVGRFVPEKDYDTALEVINSLIQLNLKIKYTIVGYGVLENQIREKVEKLGIENYVIMYINPNNISELLYKSDIYLSTSLYEGTSNSILEAMNASLPIVATEVGDNDRMVIEGCNGYLLPISDVKNIAESVAVLIKNPKMRVEMGLKSNTVLKERYSQSTFEFKYYSIIDEKV